MNSDYLKFLKHILIYSLVLGALALIIIQFLPSSFYTPSLPFLFFFFIATSLISYYFLVKSMTKKFIRFINTFFLITTLKLILYVVVMVSYVFIHRTEAIPFMMSFFILYLCYTIFEVVIILGKNSKSQTNNPGR